MEHEDLISSYLGRLTQEPLLTADEESWLIEAAQNGDERAKNRLVESNMRLVINIARNYRCRTVPIEDLIQEGAIGLMHAVDRFDAGKGFRFSTYATHWIRQCIGRSIDNKAKAIRLPAHISQSLRRIERERMRLTRELGYEPTCEQLGMTLGISARKLTLIMQSSQEMVSLDSRVGESDSSTLGSLLPDLNCVDAEASVVDSERNQELVDIMAELNDRERRVMTQRLKLEDEEDLSKIRDRLAQEMQISRERIRQIELQAIKKLRTVAQRRKLREILSN